MENAQRDWSQHNVLIHFSMMMQKSEIPGYFFKYKENVYKGISNDIYNHFEFNKCIFDGLKHSSCPFIAFSPM